MFYFGVGISGAFAVKALTISASRFIVKQASKQIAKDIDNVVVNTLARSEMAALKGAGEAAMKVTSVVKQEATLLKLARETFKGNDLLRKEANTLIKEI